MTLFKKIFSFLNYLNKTEGEEESLVESMQNLEYNNKFNTDKSNIRIERWHDTSMAYIDFDIMFKDANDLILPDRSKMLLNYDLLVSIVDKCAIDYYAATVDAENKDAVFNNICPILVIDHEECTLATYIQSDIHIYHLFNKRLDRYDLYKVFDVLKKIAN